MINYDLWAVYVAWAHFGIAYLPGKLAKYQIKAVPINKPQEDDTNHKGDLNK